MNCRCFLLTIVMVTIPVIASAQQKLIPVVDAVDSCGGGFTWCPNGKYLNIISNSHSWIWNAEKGEIPEFTLPGTAHWIADGKYLLTYDYRTESSTIWDAADGRTKSTIQAADSGDSSSDGKFTATYTSVSKKITIWNQLTGQKKFTLSEAYNSPKIFWHPESHEFAIYRNESNRVELWSADNEKKLLTFTGHEGTISSICWSPDGKIFATVGNEDETIILWNSINGQKLHTLTGHDSRIEGLIWNPDGKSFVSWQAEGNKVFLWSAASGKLLHQFVGGTSNISGASWSPDGKLIASTGRSDNSTFITEALTGKKKFELTGEIDSWKYYRSFANHIESPWSGDGSLIATHDSAKGKVILWNTGTGKIYRSLSASLQIVSGFSWNPQGSLIATRDNQSNSVEIWDPKTGKLVREIKGNIKPVLDAKWAPQGQALSILSGDPCRPQSIPPRFWVTEQNRFFSLTDSHPRFREEHWSSDGKHLALIVEPSNQIIPSSKQAVPSSDEPNESKSELVIVRTTDFKTVSRFYVSHEIDSMSWSSDNNRLLIVSPKGNAEEFDPWTGTKGRAYQLYAGPVAMSAFSPDRKLIATVPKHSFQENERGKSVVDSNGKPMLLEVSFWDVSTGRKTRSLPIGNSKFLRLHWRDDGLAIILEDDDADTIETWEILTGKKIDSQVKQTFYGTGFSWSPDGKILTKQNSEGLIELRNFATKSLISTLNITKGYYTGVSWRDDGKILLTYSQDGTTRFWNPQTGQELLTFYNFNNDNDWLVITPDGYFDASLSGTRFLRYRIEGTNELLPLERFRKDFEIPGLLHKVLNGESFAKKSGTAKLDLPPLGRILNPQTNESIAGSKVTVTAEATSRGSLPITKFRLLVNGQPAQENEGIVELPEPKHGTASASWKLDLPPGSHDLSVISYNAQSFHKSEPVPVVMLGGGVANAELPTLYVLSIGISQYKTNPLDFASADARAISAAFEKHSKHLFKKVVVVTLTDHEATEDAIKDELANFRKKMTQRDFGVFFYAGHGELDNRNKLYLLPIDAKKDRLSSTAVEGNLVVEEISGAPGRKIVILDACNSGNVLNKTRGNESIASPAVKILTSEENGVVVMCATTSGEKAQESREHGHGMFTQSFTEALSGKPVEGLSINKSAEGALYFKQIDSYVTERVQRLSKGEQHAITHYPLGVFRDFPLAKP